MSFFDDIVDKAGSVLDDIADFSDKYQAVRDQFNTEESSRNLINDIYTPERSQQANVSPSDPLVYNRLNEPQNAAVKESRQAAQVVSGLSNTTLLVSAVLLVVAVMAVK